MYVSNVCNAFTVNCHNLIIDINECTEKTYTCGNNAKCRNNKGSCRCICKTGYSGDEQECSADFFIIRCLLLKFKSLDISLTLKFFHIYFENLFQISMSVKQQHTIAVLMPFVITRRGPLTVHASLVTQEMDVTAQVGILVFYIFCMSSQTLLFSFLVFSFYVLQSLAAY